MLKKIKEKRKKEMAKVFVEENRHAHNEMGMLTFQIWVAGWEASKMVLSDYGLLFFNPCGIPSPLLQPVRDPEPNDPAKPQKL